MSISAFCLNCANVFKVNEAKAGKVVPCPRCGKMVRVSALPPVETKPGPSLVHRFFQWIFNVAFFSVLAYLFYEGGFIGILCSWFQNIRHFLFG